MGGFEEGGLRLTNFSRCINGCFQWDPLRFIKKGGSILRLRLHCQNSVMIYSSKDIYDSEEPLERRPYRTVWLTHWLCSRRCSSLSTARDDSRLRSFRKSTPLYVSLRRSGGERRTEKSRSGEKRFSSIPGREGVEGPPVYGRPGPLSSPHYLNPTDPPLTNRGRGLKFIDSRLNFGSPLWRCNDSLGPPLYLRVSPLPGETSYNWLEPGKFSGSDLINLISELCDTRFRFETFPTGSTADWSLVF